MALLVSLPFAFLLLLEIPTASPTKSTPLQLLSSEKYPLARCMDGSPGGYYYEPPDSAHAANATIWIIELQGGGECATSKLCKKHDGTALATSDAFPRSVQMTKFLNDASISRLGFTVHRVFVPYCSQDLWSGTRTSVSENETFGYYFSGRHILDAVVSELPVGMRHSIVLTGESAGGIGVWINADWLTNKLASMDARVYAVPIAGFYFYAYPYDGPGALPANESSLSDFRPPAWPSHYTVWQSATDVDCFERYKDDTPSRCLLANYSYPFVSAPSFIAEAQTDEVVLTYHDWIPSPWSNEDALAYALRWRANMSQALGGEKSIFFPACFVHTSVVDATIDGASFVGAFEEWFFDTRGGRDRPVRYVDACGAEKLGCGDCG